MDYIAIRKGMRLKDLYNILWQLRKQWLTEIALVGVTEISEDMLARKSAVDLFLSLCLEVGIKFPDGKNMLSDWSENNHNWNLKIVQSKNKIILSMPITAA